MFDRIYIPSRYSRTHVAWITAKFTRLGFMPNGICVWDSVGAFVATLKQGDRVVVHSLGVFDGSVELFCALRAIFSAGATIHSLRQAELSQKLTQQTIEALYTTSVDGLLGQKADLFRRVDPSTVERLARMGRLIQRGVSVSEASKESGCSRNIYYYYKRKDRKAVVDLQPRKAEGRTEVTRTNSLRWPQLSL